MIKLQAANGHGRVKATFVLPLADAPEPVSVLGDFNGWDPHAHPLRKRSNGTRSVAVELEPSRRYEFKYLTHGGSWFTDADAAGSAVNEYGEVNSVLET